MMEEKLISIIVPVYNAEKYLKKCLNSILKQTYHNFEVIVINDGSTDNSLRMALKYEEKDSRIRVIDKDNEGVSKTRNRGLQEAKGDYVCFVDSDDYVEESFIEDLFIAISRNDVELGVCLFNNAFLKDASIQIQPSKVGIERNEIIERNKYLEEMSKSLYSVYYGALWNKIYDISIIMNHNMRFDENISLAEDFLFNLAYLEHVKSVSIINKYNYNYYQNNVCSLTKSENIWYLWDMAKIRLLYCAEKYQSMGMYEKCEKNIDTAIAVELIAPTYCVINNKNSSLKQKCSQLKSIYNQDYIVKAIKNNKKNNMVHRIARLSLRMNSYYIFTVLMIMWVKIQRFK